MHFCLKFWHRSSVLQTLNFAIGCGRNGAWNFHRGCPGEGCQILEEVFDDHAPWDERCAGSDDAGPGSLAVDGRVGAMGCSQRTKERRPSPLGQKKTLMKFVSSLP